MPERKVIGRRMPRVDAIERVTGTAAFGADIVLPGMLHGKVLRSRYAHARIRKVDVKRALALDGVEAVITGGDMPPLADAGFANLGESQIDLRLLRQVVLAGEKAVFHGQAIAAVAAATPELAEEALALIDVEYEALPVVEDVLDAMRPDAPLIHPDLFTESLGGKAKTPSNVAAHLLLERGDMAAGFADSDVVLENTYRTQMVHQGYIEPQAATARVDADGWVTVWTTTQGAFTTKMQLAALLDIPLSKIRVIPMEIGGGFGGKIYVNLEPLCVLLARRSGRPVKMVMTREEVLRATGPASPTVITIKTGASRDGTLLAVQAKMIYDAGAFPGSPVSAGMVIGLAPYPVPNLKLEGYDVVTNKPRVNAYRAPGGPPAAFAVEGQMDAMARALRMDAVAFRLKNAAQEGDPLPNDVKLNRVGLREILERVRAHPAWRGPKDGRGRGLALGYWRGATFTSSAHMAVNADGTIALALGSVDLTGTRTSMVQIAAEEFGLEPAEVSVTMADTETVGYTDVTGGSRITYMMGAAVHRACQDALRQLRERAAAKLGVAPEDLEFRDRHFRARARPEKSISVKELAAESLVGGEGPIVGKGSASRLQPAPAYAAHVAEVEVDRETGKVRVAKYTAFQDAGCAVNPPQVEGQIQGGVAQGIGWALTEGYLFGKGVLKNATLLDYRMPTALDVPMIDAVIVEVPASDGPYGIRGVGEVPIVPPPAAIANAIYDATGVRMTELPMTPEAVFWAVNRKRQG